MMISWTTDEEPQKYSSYKKQKLEKASSRTTALFKSITECSLRHNDKKLALRKSIEYLTKKLNEL